MKKRLLKAFNGNTELMFAIKREIKTNGKEVLTPVVKKKGLFGEWTPIIRINDSYEASFIHTDYEYTETCCKQFIEGYKQKLEKERGESVKEVVYQEVV
jgi:hypothetical protein